MLDSTVDNLTRLGMTEYEARVYVALVGLGEGSARQVHEASGVPRPRVYDVLASLESMGHVEVWQGSPTLYRAVDPDTLVGGLREGMEKAIRSTSTGLKNLSVQAKHRTFPIWHIKGEWSIRKLLEETVSQAESDVQMYCARSAVLRSLVEQVRQVSRRVDVLCVVPEDAESYRDLLGEARVIVPEFAEDRLSQIYQKAFRGRLDAVDEEYRVEILLIVDGRRSVLLYESGGERTAIVFDLPLIVAIQASALSTLAEKGREPRTGG